MKALSELFALPLQAVQRGSDSGWSAAIVEQGDNANVIEVNPRVAGKWSQTLLVSAMERAEAIAKVVNQHETNLAEIKRLRVIEIVANNVSENAVDAGDMWYVRGNDMEALIAALASEPGGDSRLIECIAAQLHHSWAGWFVWMRQNWGRTHSSGESFLDRWERQANTFYNELPENEKESDRKEAYKILAVINKALNQSTSR